MGEYMPEPPCSADYDEYENSLAAWITYNSNAFIRIMSSEVNNDMDKLKKLAEDYFDDRMIPPYAAFFGFGMAEVLCFLDVVGSDRDYMDDLIKAYEKYRFDYTPDYDVSDYIEDTADYRDEVAW